MKFFLHKIAVFVLAVGLLFLVAELGIRLSGNTPYAYYEGASKINSNPSPLFVPDSLLGYTYSAGRFVVSLNNKITYSLTIDSFDHRRLTEHNRHSKRQVNIYGCSFFAGMGVNDSEVLSAQLETMDSTYSVCNYSIPGHGLTTQLLQFRNHLKHGNTPEWAVFSVASFHLPRNVSSFTYLKTFGNVSDAPVMYPRAQMNLKQLEFDLVPVAPVGERLARASALYTSIITAHDALCLPLEYQLRVQSALIEEIMKTAIVNHVKPIFHIITEDTPTADLVVFLTEHDYPFINSSVNYKDTAYNLMPADGHPNARAHRLYAHEIFKVLHNNQNLHNYTK